jgi:hypothetical protein
MCKQTVEAAKGQIQWMNKAISEEFDRKTQSNPFDLQVVKTVKSLTELDEEVAAKGPKVSVFVFVIVVVRCGLWVVVVVVFVFVFVVVVVVIL